MSHPWRPWSILLISLVVRFSARTQPSSFCVATAQRLANPRRHTMAKDGTAGVSVMRAELDAATSSSADVQEAQWRAGVNRQAQPAAAEHQQRQAAQGGMARQALPDAYAHQLAASRAAADSFFLRAAWIKASFFMSAHPSVCAG